MTLCASVRKVVFLIDSHEQYVFWFILWSSGLLSPYPQF